MTRVGDMVTVRGRASTTVLRRGQTVAGVEVTEQLLTLIRGGWVEVIAQHPGREVTGDGQQG